MSLADELPELSGPAATLLRHVQRYLIGSLNEEALNAWLLAIARATAGGVALDAALLDICATYLKAAPERSEAP